MPHTFGDDERVAAQDDRDVVMPAGKAAAFEVVEAELAFQVLVDALCAPALHHDPYELLLRHALGQRRQEVVRRLRFAVAPFDQQPEFLAVVGRKASLVRGNDPPGGEAR
jgi:hypothetical protein